MSTNQKNFHKIPNKLIVEQSPYLLQHAYYPVQWYPYGDETLALARDQQKPILVAEAHRILEETIK